MLGVIFSLVNSCNLACWCGCCGSLRHVCRERAVGEMCANSSWNGKWGFKLNYCKNNVLFDAIAGPI